MRRPGSASITPSPAHEQAHAHAQAGPHWRAPSRAHWGLHHPQEAAAARVERAWRLPVMAGLLTTIPAFYADMLDVVTPVVATLAYAIACLLVGAALLHTALRCSQASLHLRRNPVDLLLVASLAASALLPGGAGAPVAVGVRLAASLLALVRMLWAMQPLITRGGLTYLLLLSLGVLGLCGAGFWWLEPTTPTFGEGLWLAFTTAATVGYGDIVPTTPAAKIFAVFVVLLGFGVLTMVTAAIATSWIETEERRIEREILLDLRAQIDTVRSELSALRAEQRAAAHLLAQGRIETSPPTPKHPRG